MREERDPRGPSGDDEGPLPALAALPIEIEPPASLEGIVERRLRAEGLLRGRRARLPWALAATLLTGLALGSFAGSLLDARRDVAGGAQSADPTSSPRFALLLWEGSGYRPAEPPQVAARVAEYGRWAAALRAEGLTVQGEKLATEARLVSGPRPAADSTVPATPALGELGGFFVLEAASLEQAERLAATCPHVAYGGTIEVRRIEG